MTYLLAARQLADRIARVSMDLGIPSTTSIDSKATAEVAATIRELCDEVERLTSQCARYAQERNMALNLNAARAQQLAQAWLEVDKARAALQGDG